MLFRSFVSIKTFAAEDGERVTISEFDSLEAVNAWRANLEHLTAQRRGRAEFYAEYSLQTCELVREAKFSASKACSVEDGEADEHDGVGDHGERLHEGEPVDRGERGDDVPHERERERNRRTDHCGRHGRTRGREQSHEYEQQRSGDGVERAECEAGIDGCGERAREPDFL